MFYRLCKYRIWHLFVESYNLQWFSTYPVNVFYLLCVVDIQYFVNVMVYHLWKDIICLIGIYYYYYYFCFTCLESALHEPTTGMFQHVELDLCCKEQMFLCVYTKVSNQEVLTLTGCQATFDVKNIGKLKKYRNFCFQI